MRLLGLVPYPYDKAPGQRFRIEQWAPFLAQSGVEVTFEAFRCDELHELLCKPGNNARKIALTIKALGRRLRVLRHLKEFDLVYVYNEAAFLGPALFEHYVDFKRTPIVYDFDDAIFLHYAYISPVNRSLRLLKFPGKTGAICRMASHVIVGNSYLANYAAKFNHNVTVVPTTVDTEHYTVADSSPQNDLPIIGWTGSYSTLQYLNLLKPALQQLARSQRFKLRVIAVPDYRIEGVEVESLPWRSDTEVADLRGIDIGIMPMPDDDWTRGKCGLKALQFMALGIPTVCAPVGVNSGIIQQDQNGLLASSDEQWIEALTRLLNSPTLRERLGKAGRLTIEANYSTSVHAPRVLKILESAFTHQQADGAESVIEVGEMRTSKVEIVVGSVLNDNVDA